MGGNSQAEPRAWLVRGSKDTRYDRWMFENGYTAVDFRDVGDLGQATNLQSMRDLVTQAFPEEKNGTISNYAAQLNAFANKITIGDIVVLPMTRDGLLAFGTVTGPHENLADSDGLPHARRVTWHRPDVARTSISQDLLYSLGAFSTVCEVKRNDAAYRFSKIIAGAEQDPGNALASF